MLTPRALVPLLAVAAATLVAAPLASYDAPHAVAKAVDGTTAATAPEVAVGMAAVADTGNHRIQVLNADGTPAFEFGSEGRWRGPP